MKMSKICSRISSVVVLLLWQEAALGALWTDDFSDGDDTHNPQWIHFDPGTGLNPSWSVVEDGTGNMVYELRVDSNGVDRPMIGAYVTQECPNKEPGTKEDNFPWPGFPCVGKDAVACFDPDGFTGYSLRTHVVWGDGCCTEPGEPPDEELVFEVSLVRLDSGEETVLASTMMPLVTEPMTDYIQNFNGRIVAKKWLTSEPEPEEYLFDVIDDTYSGGYSGILISTIPENAAVAWRFDNFTGLPEPATLALLALGGAALAARRRKG